VPDDSRCDVCSEATTTFVSSLPGIPISVARCRDCLHAGAVPLAVAVATTADVGGMDRAAGWWVETVEVTLERLRVPRGDFDQMVSDCIRAELDAFDEADAQDAIEDWPPSGDQA
jgi:hypothetical protein